MKQNLFFDKVEEDVYRLLKFEEDIREIKRPDSFNKHQLDYFQDHFILALEEELVEARDRIGQEGETFSHYHKLVEFLENLLDEFYKLEKI